MQYVGKVFSTVSQLYKELNPATLSGAIDVVVVEDKDGELSCSPFHVRFGKLQLLRPSDKVVQVIVNDRPAEFYMKVGDSGEGFFVLETEADVPSQFATSPVASPALSFRGDDDPDFLDLGGDVRVQDLEDGYVSAHSAHGSDADEPDSDAEGRRLPPLQTVGQQNHSSVLFAALPPPAPRRRTRSSSVSLAKSTAGAAILSEDDARRRSFVDDMAIDMPQHALAACGSPRRRLSVVSDSAYIVDLFAGRAAHIDSGVGDSGSGGGVDVATPAGDDAVIHTDWDWGVGIEPAKGAHAAGPDVDSASAGDTQPQHCTRAEVAGLLQLHPGRVLELSLCGLDQLCAAQDAAAQRQVFGDALVAAEDYASDPSAVMASPDLVFRLGGSTYVQREALVMSLVSQMAFDRPLDSLMLDAAPGTDAGPVVATEGYFAGNAGDTLAAHDGLTSGPAGAPSVASIEQEGTASARPEGAAVSDRPEGRRWWQWGQRAAAAPAAPAAAMLDALAIDTPRLPLAETAAAQSCSDLPLSASFSADEGGGYMSDSGQLAHPTKTHVRYAKTLRLTSGQLKSLGLQPGANDIKFLVPSNKAYCEARIFLYRHDTQIVISDIDGTITKSDALGHLFNMVGKDWTHHGVAKLYTDIASNGYEILYLTSRAIGQADGTRYFLNNVRQGQYRLPLGPLLLSPDRLFTSFHREVIMRRPQEFKMACLRDIKKLFGDLSPFYAGFGNRITDAMSYRSVNVPVSRICTIDSSGEIKLELLSGYTSSYVRMNDLVDMMFPALSSKLDPKFNDWEYWKAGMPSVDDELALIDAELARESAAAASRRTKAPVAQPMPDQLAQTAGVRGSSPVLQQTRESRAMSIAARHPSDDTQSPPRVEAQVWSAAMSTPELVGRQRADSWTATTPVQPAAGNTGGRMSILRKATAFSPFGFVRGSSPPKFEYESAASTVTIAATPAGDGVLFPQLPGDSSPPVPNHAPDGTESVATMSFEFSHIRVSSPGEMPLRHEEGHGPELHVLDDDGDDDDDGDPVASDPAVAAAATRLVPQVRPTIHRADSQDDPSSVQRTESNMSLQSRGYSGYERDAGSDDSNDGDDDDDIDQETLAIMQDMEQLQRLQ
ncbi:lipin Ned1 [Coemansia biformis]|uniref:phosphatidate phosphatase n=1 Tax=Coemansia biformis TaxID=1286918 RepID=A0A9W7YEK3_9FUNG|nr:lipin Ned1 [Coemansia biformis]